MTFADDDSPKAEPGSAKQDQRHLKRVALMQELFAFSFFADKDQTACLSFQPDKPSLIKSLVLQLPQIDAIIQQHAPERPLTEINQVDLAILRVIVWESLHKNTPRKVLIDEGVELAKTFGSESSPRFVNGVLGKLMMN